VKIDTSATAVRLHAAHTRRENSPGSRYIMNEVSLPKEYVTIYLKHNVYDYI